MRNKTILFIILCITLIFSGCFSPWGSEQGTLTISVGGRSAAREAVSWLNNADSEDFLHILTLTGPGQKQEVRFIGSKSMTFTVITGLWNVTVKAYDLKGPTNYPDNLEQIDISRYNLIAEGSEDINVRGGNNSVKIQMKTPKSNDGSLWDGTYHIIVGVIPGQNGWLDHNNAKGTLTYGNVEVTIDNDTYDDTNSGEYTYIKLDYYGINNGTDTVTIKAIPDTDKGFHFVKWVIVGNYIGQGGMDGTGEIINKAPLQINLKGSTITAEADMENIKISDIEIPNDAGFNFYILAVFDGNGDSSGSPKNITHAGTGDGGLRSMDMDKDYALMTDLELSGSWTPIGTGTSAFNGSLNGMGRTITYNFDKIETVDGTEQHAGLFGVIGNAGVVKNLILEGSISNVVHNAGNSLYIGAVAGENKNMIYNVVSSVNINCSGLSGAGKIYAGGIAGKNSSLIKNCTGVGAIANNANSSIDYGGGIVGLISDGGKVYCCWASGSIDIIKDNGYAGGIAGSITGTSIYTSNIRNCLAVNSRISNISSNTGRIVGNSPSEYCVLSNNYAYISTYTPTSPDATNKEGADVSNRSTDTNSYYSASWWTSASNWYDSVTNWSRSISLYTTPDEDTPWIWSSSRYGTNHNAPYLILWFSK